MTTAKNFARKGGKKPAEQFDEANPPPGMRAVNIAQHPQYQALLEEIAEQAAEHATKMAEMKVGMRARDQRIGQLEAELEPYRKAAEEAEREEEGLPGLPKPADTKNPGRKPPASKG